MTINTSINPVVKTSLVKEEVIVAAIAADEVTDAATYAKVFSGTAAATAVQMSKIGDIYVKTDTPHIYLAKSTTKTSGWVQVD